MMIGPGCGCIEKLPQFPGPFDDKYWKVQPASIVREDLSPIVSLVVSDMIARALQGKQKYGVALTAKNGRSALRDAYEEAMDLTLYLKQALEESEDE